MFHIASKLLQFATNPVLWLFCMLLWAVFVKNLLLKKRLLILNIVLFYLFSNAFLLDEINRLWEPELSSRDVSRTYPVCIVLGGYSDYAPRSGQVSFSDASDRLTEAIRLYKKGYAKKILLSGGAGSLMDFRGQEAEYIAEYLYDIGISRNDIWIDSQSKNTRQNALQSAQILSQKSISDTVLLITSTTHMIRAGACFRKAGVVFKPFCTDGMTGERKFYPDHILVPKAEILLRWNTIIHEWVGYLIYSMAGYV